MPKTVCIISDTQMPYHDGRALKSLLNFIRDFQPDEVVHIGDLMDYPQPSRWCKGTAAEYEGSIIRDSEKAQKKFLIPLREVYDGPVGVHEGNHDMRCREYLHRYAPALVGTDQFNFEKLLDFDGLGITLLDEFYDVAPGTVTTHGHRGKISLSRVPGSTAVNAAKNFGKSVVIGHTHRLAIVPHSTGYAQTVKHQVFGMEVGHLMDMKQANYLKGGTGNWQQGFALLRVEGRYVKPEIVPIHKGRFMVDNHVWEV